MFIKDHRSPFSSHMLDHIGAINGLKSNAGILGKIQTVTLAQRLAQAELRIAEAKLLIAQHEELASRSSMGKSRHASLLSQLRAALRNAENDRNQLLASIPRGNKR
jgi:hypothetical protein